MSGTWPRRLLRVAARVLAMTVALAGIGLATGVVAGADPSYSVWDQLRGCESSGDYSTVSDTGKHRGAYQFDLPTWESVGGSGMPEEADPSEQDYRALYLYRMRGWQPWECAGILGLQGDEDAASGQEPSRADASYIGGDEPSEPSGDDDDSGDSDSGDSGDSGPPADSGDSGDAPEWDGYVYARGDCAPSLRTFQLRMNEIGSPYHFQGTGCYAQHTYTAVVALQKANDINPSGRLGPKTWKAAWEGEQLG